MAISVQLTRFNETLYRSALILGIQNPDSATVDIIESAPFTLADLKEAHFMSALEIMTLIADTLDHPFRNYYLTETPAELNDGDKLPPAVGIHSKVMIKIGNDYRKGRLAKNYLAYERAKDYPEIYGDGERLYWIEAGILNFIGLKAQVYNSTVNIDRTVIAATNFLPVPENYANAVIGNSFKMLYLNGQDFSQRKFYYDQALMMLGKIEGKDLSIPEAEQFTRLNA